MGFTELSAPVTSSDGDDGEFCEGDGTTDGCRDFLGALDTQTNMALGISNGNESLESCTLAGTGLLLNGHDLHDLVFEFWEEKVDDLILLDREREEVDFLYCFDLPVLHKAAEFCDGIPSKPQMRTWGRYGVRDGVRTIPCPRPFGHHDGHGLVPFRDRHGPYQIHRVRVHQRQPLCCSLERGISMMSIQTGLV